MANSTTVERKIMGICFSSNKLHAHVHISEREGSGDFVVRKDGNLIATYSPRGPHGPERQEAVATLERKLFKACCEAPGLDYKPRVNIRKHFLKYNTPEDHGPIPRPSARTLSNPDYQGSVIRCGVEV